MILMMLLKMPFGSRSVRIYRLVRGKILQLGGTAGQSSEFQQYMHKCICKCNMNVMWFEAQTNGCACFVLSYLHMNMCVCNCLVNWIEKESRLKLIHPRRVNSWFLLSGSLYDGRKGKGLALSNLGIWKQCCFEKTWSYNGNGLEKDLVLTKFLKTAVQFSSQRIGITS